MILAAAMALFSADMFDGDEAGACSFGDDLFATNSYQAPAEEISDDDSEAGAGAPQASASDGAGAPQLSKQKPPSKRAPRAPAKKRQRRESEPRPTESILMTKLAAGQCMDCKYVGVARDAISKRTKLTKASARDGGSAVPVPLWPLYASSKPVGDGPVSKWIIVSPWEQWLAQVIVISRGQNKFSPKARAIAQNVMTKLREDFVPAIGSARKKIAIDSDSQEGDVAEEKSSRKLTFKNIIALPVLVGGHEITVVNSMKPFIVRIDEAGFQFVATYVLDIVLKASDALGIPDANTQSSKSDVPIGPSFSFAPSQTPNLRGKVNWCPLDHSWKLTYTRAKIKLSQIKEEFSDGAFCGNAPDSAREIDSSSGKAIRVSRDGGRGAVDARKNTAYHLAVLAWNKIDGSTRHRIRFRLDDATSAAAVADVMPARVMTETIRSDVAPASALAVRWASDDRL